VRYRILSKEGIDVARAALNERKRVPNLAAFEVVVGSGDQFDDSILETLSARIRKIQAQVDKDQRPP
jgi:hypothetical protein